VAMAPTLPDRPDTQPPLARSVCPVHGGVRRHRARIRGQAGVRDDRYEIIEVYPAEGEPR